MSYFKLLSNICCVAIVLKTVFLYSWEAKNPCFYDEKLFKIFLYLCIYFFQKTAQLILEKLYAHMSANALKKTPSPVVSCK